MTVRTRPTIKQQPHGLRDVLVKVDTRRPRTLITPFPAPGSRGIFADGRVTIETDAGVKTSGLDESRTYSTFVGSFSHAHASFPYSEFSRWFCSDGRIRRNVGQLWFDDIATRG
ncbi:hypothetical protein ACVWZZ_002588 [Bradyrhizobium sp. LM6.10]